jgi:adiponectin receptor
MIDRIPYGRTFMPVLTSLEKDYAKPVLGSPNCWLLNYEELPNWFLCYANKFVLKGYRPIFNDGSACLCSLFQWHNESMNIWTHLLPGCCYFLVMLHATRNAQLTNSKDLMWIFLVVSMMYAFLSSAGFHLYMCHSEEVARFSVRCDMVGIIVHLGSMSIYILWHMLRCQVEKLQIVMLCIIVYIAGLTYICTTKEFTRKKYKVIKPLPFIGLGLVLMYPMLQWSSDPTMQPQVARDQINFWNSVAWILLITATVFYSSRFPERYFPGDFDFFGNSHNWFHIFVNISNCCAIYSAMKVSEYDWCPVDA